LTATKFKNGDEHQTIDDNNQDSGKNLQQKYHLMKKKLKKQKDVAESQAAQIEELRGQVDEL
jgi:hypothetical protein